MPLAIELAAGWTRTLSLPELQHEIEKSLNVLSSTLRDVPPRLRSMHAAFDHSWRLLSPKERDVMRQFSVFRGGCTRGKRPPRSWGATVTDLAGLVDKSWLRLRDGGRYAIHELARQYCEEKLEAVDEANTELSAAAVRSRHCVYYGAYLDSFFRNMNYEPKTLDDILLEFANLLTALYTAVAIHEMHTALFVSGAVFFVGDMMGWLHFSIETLNPIRAVLEEQLADPALQEPEWTEVAHVICGILHAQYSQYGQVGLLSEAGACNTQIVSLVEQMAAGRTQVYWRTVALYDQETLNYKRGLHAAAYAFGLQVLPLIASDEFDCYYYGKERGHAFWGAEAYGCLGLIALALGDYAASERHFNQSFALRDASGEQRFKGMFLGHCARLAQITGALERGSNSRPRACASARSTGTASGSAWATMLWAGHCLHRAATRPRAAICSWAWRRAARRVASTSSFFPCVSWAASTWRRANRPTPVTASRTHWPRLETRQAQTTTTRWRAYGWDWAGARWRKRIWQRRSACSRRRRRSAARPRSRWRRRAPGRRMCCCAGATSPQLQQFCRKSPRTRPPRTTRAVQAQRTLDDLRSPVLD